MSLNRIYDIAGSSLSAQTTRMNTIAGNMANAENVSSTPEDVYKARRPVFAEMVEENLSQYGSRVSVTEIQESNQEPRVSFQPNNPMADDEGNVYFPNVNTIEEMVDMMAATQSYQSSVEMMSNARKMQERLLSLGS